MTAHQNLFAAPIVPLDGSEISERALPVAAALARQAGTKPTLVMVVSHPDHMQEAESLLDRAAGQLGDLDARTEVLVGLPAASRLLEYLAQEGTVVVMSTHAHHAIGELVLGSVAEEVVRRSPCPVVLVGPQVDLPAAANGYEDLVAGIDANSASVRLSPVIHSCVSELGMKPVLFQVVPMDSRPSVDVSEVGSVKHAADRLAADGVEVDWEVGHGDVPARSIVDFTQTRVAPMTALATHGRDPAERLRAESTTVAVARHATCPVLVVGPCCQSLDG